MKHNLKRVLAVLIAVLLALPTFAFAEEPADAIIAGEDAIGLVEDEPVVVDDEGEPEPPADEDIAFVDAGAEAGDDDETAEGAAIDLGGVVVGDFEEPACEELTSVELIPGEDEGDAPGDEPGDETGNSDGDDIPGDTPDDEGEEFGDGESGEESGDDETGKDGETGDDETGKDGETGDDDDGESGEEADAGESGEEPGDGEPGDDGEPGEESGDDDASSDASDGSDAAAQAVRVVFEASPEDAAVTVYPAADADAVYPAADADEPAEEAPAPEAIPAEDDGTYLLLPGEYTYSAEAEGYAPLLGVPFTVTESQEPLRIPFALEAVAPAKQARNARPAGARYEDELEDVSFKFPDGHESSSVCRILNDSDTTWTSEVSSYDPDYQWDAGWYAVTSDVEISGRVQVVGTVHLILGDGVKLTVSEGITVNSPNSLTIWRQKDGTGKLYAGTDGKGNNTCHAGCAGIGGQYSNGSTSLDYGTITINGGNVYARGSDAESGYGAAIGNCSNLTKGGGKITIAGGYVNAKASSNAAAIGGTTGNTAGDIVIEGGEVVAESTMGAAIGSGAWGRFSSIAITGGTVTAKSDSGTGIGGTQGRISITGGKVTAQGKGGAGISGGDGGSVLLNWSPTSSGDAPAQPYIKANSYAGEVKLGMSFIQDGGSEVFYGGQSPDLTKLAEKPIKPYGYYRVSVKPGILHGSITLGNDHEQTIYAKSGASVIVNVDPADNYQLSRLSYTGETGGGPVSIPGNGNTYTFAMPADNLTIDAFFDRIELTYYDPFKPGSQTCPADSILIDDLPDPSSWRTGWYYSLSNLTIDKQVVVTGNVNLVLLNDMVLTAAKGISVPKGSSLTIWGESALGDDGRLIANGGDNCAGIGGGGAITINGGAINPTGGSGGAGIDAEGGVTVNFGVVNAKGGESGAGIGGNSGKSGGTILLQGGTINADGGYYAAGIGGGKFADGGSITIKGAAHLGSINGGSSPYGGGYVGGGGMDNLPNDDTTVDHATAIGGGAGIGGGAWGSGGTINISGNVAIDEAFGGLVKGVGGAGIGGGNNGSGGTINISGGTVGAIGAYNAAGIGGGENGDGGVINITGGDVSSRGGIWSSYDCGGAGIGGGRYKDGGKITIRGKDTKVTAYAANLAAAIGGGKEGNGGEILIEDGTVYAYCTSNSSHNCWYGAGIGGGYAGAGGKITIKGGTITATGGSQGGFGALDVDMGGAGIGGGTGAACGTILIEGGTIVAQGGVYSAGIGCGGITTAASSTGGTITITGGDITAKGYQLGAGIGGGYHCPCGSISISGGNILEAKSVRGGAGIGGGYQSGCGEVTISGGTIKALAAPEMITPTYIHAGTGIGDGGGVNGSIGTVKLTFSATGNGTLPDKPRVYADDYKGNITLLKTFKNADDGAEEFAAGDYTADPSPLAGKTIVPTNLFSLIIDGGIQHGQVRTDPEGAARDKTRVEVFCTVDDDYVLDELYITPEGGTAQPLAPDPASGRYFFTMPMSDVTVGASIISEWTWLQRAIDQAASGAVIDLTDFAGNDNTITAQEGDKALNIASGKAITLNLNGCTLDRGLDEAADGGGVITVIGSLTVSGDGTITGGRTTGNGGGVLVDGGTFAMAGGAITGNDALGDGGGVYVKAGSSFSIQGAPVISNNTRGDEDSNVFLPDGQVIGVAGPLGGSASVGVTSGAPPVGDGAVVITSGFPGNGALKNFHSDAKPFSVWTDADGEAALVARTITLSPDPLKLDMGRSKALKCAFFPETETMPLMWSSSDPDVAAVSDAGVVKGRKAGEAVITARSADGAVEGTCAVKVIVPTKLSMAKTATVKKGKKLTLKVTVKGSAGNPLLKAKSANKKIATVKMVGKKLVITGKKTGKVKVTVTTADGKVKAVCTVKVTSNNNSQSLLELK